MPAIRGRLAGIGEARLVLCGHTHIARIVASGAVLVVNPAASACPAIATAGPCRT